MSFRIIRNDITKVQADAIVNAANRLPCIGRGTDSAIYAAAGRDRLLEAREKIGIIDPGQSVMTPAFDLTEKNGVKYIIHTVGIRYKDGSYGERTILRSCYSNSLKVARRLGCRSIAFPLLASGHFNFPKGMAMDIAVEELEDFLREYDMDIILVVYDEESFTLSERLSEDIQSFIDANYIEDNADNESHNTWYNGDRNADPTSTNRQLKEIPDLDLDASVPAKKVIGKRAVQLNVRDFVQEVHQPLDFKNLLQKLIADRNLSNADVYRGTTIDRKYFSKIISPKNKYIPKKRTVIQLGINLRLNIEEFEDFLATANYALNPHLKEDIVVEYCIMNEIYPVMKVDLILVRHGLPSFYEEYEN